jgi:ribosomal protein S18 acetylase RimI-like enzyme
MNPGPAQKFTIVRAKTADVDLAREAMLELHERKAFDRDAILKFLADSANYLFLALEGERVIGSLFGYALVHPPIRKPQFLLYEIDVRSQSRRRGIGKALVQAFISAARAAGAFEVWVITNQSNTAAMAMYAACGLRRENPDDVMLAIPLTESPL